MPRTQSRCSLPCGLLVASSSTSTLPLASLSQQLILEAQKGLQSLDVLLRPAG